MRTLTKKDIFPRAERILEGFRENKYFISRLNGLYLDCRIKYFLQKFPEVRKLNNLEKNWLLCKVNKIVGLNICPFYYFSEQRNKQYCHPKYLEKNKPDLILKINSCGINYCLDKLECNCDLTKGCKKRDILT